MIAMAASNTGRYAAVGTAKVHYHDVGEGEPVVLIHGGGPGANGWSNYDRNIAALVAAGYRLIIPDLLGFGLSDKPAVTGKRYSAHARTIIGLLDALKIDSAHLVGNSLGGGAALKLTLDAPERVRKLVLMGPAGLISAYTRVPTEGARLIFEYYGGNGPSREKLAAFIKLMVCDASQLTDELLENRFAASVDPAVVANPPFGRAGGGGAEDLWRDERLSALPHDTLVLWGREDRVNPLYTAEILLNQLPNARLVSFTRCGHWVQWERAAEFNAIVSGFLSGRA
jgi:2-hydroxy-6-oxonona-2,4-dienedioate hydrolase/4,5:9,10-diseco-3-hydroxy-5,9,17-trioxoandrosta-1(10),2-diene-4-oate hydrolase